EGSTVIRAFQANQLTLSFAASAMTGQPRQLNGSLDSLRAAVGEERTLQAGQSTKLFGQQPLKLVVVEIRKVNHSSGLFADYLHDSRMRMAQRIHAETGYEIEIAFAIQIVKKNAFAALEDQRVAVVGLKQKLTFAFDDFVRVWHRERRLYRRGTYLPNADLRSATKSGTGSGMWACKVLLTSRLTKCKRILPKIIALRNTGFYNHGSRVSHGTYKYPHVPARGSENAQLTSRQCSVEVCFAVAAHEPGFSTPLYRWPVDSAYYGCRGARLD